ncbi:ribosome maturation factor RimP [Clostridium sp.]|uniref:ribosome maturation factor RimP n=1 Tax=Clostridium sp. TaxID=1506 RepID=UPI00261DE6AA|nr:ribosome maturation factor RimP [Clostridium sp.]
MKKEQLEAGLEALCAPIVEEKGYSLYHIEYVKENNEYYLRLYIEKPEERISLRDCEVVSRALSDMLDEKDPIKDAYFLEVSSTGLNRKLYTDEHFKRFIGSEVFVGFKSSLSGKKNVKGILKDVQEDTIIIEFEGNDVKVPKEKIKTANLEGEI